MAFGPTHLPRGFHYFINTAVLNPKAQTSVILGWPFLATLNAIINCRNGSMCLIFGDMTKAVNVFHLRKQSRDLDDQTFKVNLIEWTWGKARIRVWTWIRFGVGWLQSWPNSWLRGRMGNKHKPDQPFSERRTLNEQISSSELKALPSHLKYKYLGERKLSGYHRFSFNG